MLSVVPVSFSELVSLVVVFDILLKLVFINYCSLTLLTHSVKVLGHDIGLDRMTCVLGPRLL